MIKLFISYALCHAFNPLKTNAEQYVITTLSVYNSVFWQQSVFKGFAMILRENDAYFLKQH